MTTPRDIDNYGGVFSDAEVVEDPTTEISSAYDNRLHEDVAQMTRTTLKYAFTFPTETSVAPQTIPSGSISVRSHAGTGSAARPVVTKTGTGLYTATCPVSFTDGLTEVEAISFFAAGGSVQHVSLLGHVQCSVSANVISIIIVDLAGTPTDLTDGTSIGIWAI